jgi:hypothetical protein
MPLTPPGPRVHKKRAWFLGAAALGLSLVVPALALADPPAPRRTTIPHEEPIPIDNTPQARVLVRAEPTYPVEEWRAGMGDLVAFEGEIDASGHMEATLIQGGGAFEQAARQALARWRFGRDQPGDAGARAYVLFDFAPDRVVYDPVEHRVLAVAAQPLVSYPFDCAAGAYPALARRNQDIVVMHVEATGLVSGASFLGDAPPDSESVRDAALHWAFRPFVAPDGPRGGHAIPIWAPVRIERPCARWGVRLLAAPDSVMRSILHSHYTGSAGRVVPSSRVEHTISDVGAGNDEWLETTASSRCASTRRVDGDSLRALVRAILESPVAQRGRAWTPGGALPEPRYALILWGDDHSEGPTGMGKLEVTISPDARLVTARTGRSALFIPYASAPGPVDALVHALFP